MSQSIFSVFFVFWNVLVAISLLVSSRKLVSQNKSYYTICDAYSHLIIQKNDIANLNLLLQDEVYLIKDNLRKMFGEETWLTCHDHLWLEEDSNGFALKEKNLTKNKHVVVKHNPQKGLVDIEGITENQTKQFEDAFK